jgi:hypothetical protein
MNSCAKDQLRLLKKKDVHTYPGVVHDPFKTTSSLTGGDKTRIKEKSVFLTFKILNRAFHP